jgi:hypothetical protein
MDEKGFCEERSDEAICSIQSEYQIKGLLESLRKVMKDCFTSFAKSRL